MTQPSDAQVNLQQEELAIRRAGTLSLLLCGLCFGLGYVTLPPVFEFPAELVNRLAFALQASLFVLIWVLIGVIMVSTGRLDTPRAKATGILGSSTGL
ncbi:MAG: hypothetical protein EA395_04755, partial [Phormidium sp. GEM2.Bin31]